MPTRRTVKPSRKENVPGADRVQKYVGKRKVSFYYLYPNGTSETLASAAAGDRKAITEAEKTAKRKALEIQEGKIIAGSVAEAIDRFREEEDGKHFLSQSKDAKGVREGEYRNLKDFFGKMEPTSLKMIHGYQYLDDRANAGAPIKANKEMSLMSTMSNKWVRWGLIEANPFIGLEQNVADKDVRDVARKQIIRFYLWSRRQGQLFQTMGCAALFTYLTGFRAAEVRPFHVSGLGPEGVRVLSAKRKKGEAQIVKLREWSTKLQVVVARAKKVADLDWKGEKRTVAQARPYLFGNTKGRLYTKSGWGSVWEGTMWEWIASFDVNVATALALRREWDIKRREDTKNGMKSPPFDAGFKLIDHPMYFSLLDVRPTAITQKKEQRAADTYDFAAHANPSTTDRHYDRRKVRKASATE